MAGDLAAYWRKVARAQDFHLRVVARERRERAIELGKGALARNRGDLLDFRTFGSRSLSMIVEMEGSRVLSLLDSLDALGWEIDLGPDREALARRGDDSLAGTFRLSFAAGDGELPAPVPAVSG